MGIIEDIKAIAKDGADLTGIIKAIDGLNPMDAIKTKEEAWSFIKANDILLNTLDQKVTERVKTAEENIMSGKFQDALREKEVELETKYKPKDETEAQIARRELKEYKASVTAKESFSILQDELSEKAKEVGFDPLEARKFAVLGKDALGFLESRADSRKAAIEAARNEVIKGKFNKEGPKKPIDVNTLSALSDNDLNAVAFNNPAMKQAVLEEVKRRNRPQ